MSFKKGGAGSFNMSCAPIAARWSIEGSAGVRGAERGKLLFNIVGTAGDAPVLGWSSSRNDNLQQGVRVGMDVECMKG
jgi:hypothetical protein